VSGHDLDRGEADRLIATGRLAIAVVDYDTTPPMAGYRRQHFDLHSWLRADGGVQTRRGAAVASWTDQSTNGFTASISDGAYQPLLVHNAINGRPALRFDGGE